MIIDFFGDYHANEGVLKVNLYSKRELKCTNLDITDTLEYFDKYTPYKYGIIFRERLFVNHAEIFATFRMSLFRAQATQAQVEDKNQGKEKDPKKPQGGKQALQLQNAIIPGIDIENSKELEEQKLIYLELYEENTLRMKVSGFNEAVLYNAVLKGDKNNHANYYLQARFDLREVPEATQANNFTKNLGWSIHCNSNEVIYI